MEGLDGVAVRKGHGGIMKRSPIKRKTPIRKRRTKPRLRAGRVPPNPAYLVWVRKQPCVGLEDWPSNSHGDHGVQGHYCFGPVQASHDRNHTGMGIKDPDETCVPMCLALHNQWESHHGRYEGWDNEQRHAYMRVWRATLNYRYTSETGVELPRAA